MSESGHSLKKGEELEVEIESLAFGGEGVARHNDFVIFVREALPGQILRVQILRKKKKHAHARILNVLRQSPDYQDPVCRHFPDCGGCALQHLAYEKQLSEKTGQVAGVLRHLGAFADPPVLPALPAPEQFFYRNKMEYTFAPQRWLTRAEIAAGEQIVRKDFALGLHVRGFYQKIIQIEHCWLQSELSNALRNTVSKAVAQSSLQPYTTRNHSGFWRFLVIREGKATGEKLLNIVTADGGDQGNHEVDAVAEKLLAEFPGELTTLVHTINRSKAQVATGDEIRILHGSGYFHEKIGRWTFRVSANSFFQTNTAGAAQLYAVARDFAALLGDETLFDLYCGAGTIGLYLSDRAKTVVGVEVNAEAVIDAKKNATLNNAGNCHFFSGDLKDILLSESHPLHAFGKPEVVVFDPPRAGVHEKVLRVIAGLAPERIVYVSCNPATFARDARILCENDYALEKVQPVDMFPHTPHIELVARLEKR